MPFGMGLNRGAVLEQYTRWWLHRFVGCFCALHAFQWLNVRLQVEHHQGIYRLGCHALMVTKPVGHNLHLVQFRLNPARSHGITKNIRFECWRRVAGCDSLTTVATWSCPKRFHLKDQYDEFFRL